MRAQLFAPDELSARDVLFWAVIVAVAVAVAVVIVVVVVVVVVVAVAGGIRSVSGTQRCPRALFTSAAGGA
jgi:hypothetical protein